MPVDYEVHKVERVPGTTQTRVVKVNPYVRLCAEGAPPLFIQGAHIFSAEGPEVALDDLPTWFWSEAERVSPQVQQETGLAGLLAARRGEPMMLPTLPPTPPFAWTCPECGVAMALKKKGLHVARHRRAPKE